MKYEITELRTSAVVRPQGCLGTMGWIDGKAWDARFFKSRAEAQTWINKQTKKRSSNETVPRFRVSY